MKNEISLYVHIPFCESKCHYCSFVSIKSNEEFREKYVEYLIKEIKLCRNNTFAVKSIFIGGGTPSILSGEQIERILSAIYENFLINKDAEITIEANPNSFSKEKAEIYKKSGINRISFGLQSDNDDILKTIGRVHTKEDFFRAIEFAKNAGFENINADVMLGLPNQKLSDVESTLETLISQDVTHISCYSLILEEGTKLNSWVENGEIILPTEDETVKMYDFCLKFLEKHKIFRYEVSNFAKKGFESAHNLTYWTGGNYLGLGLNSHSKIGDKRSENTANFSEYFFEIDKLNFPIKNKITLSKDEKREEFVMLSLRIKQGIDCFEYEKLFNENLIEAKKQEIEFLTGLKLIKCENGHIFCTNKGYKVLNQIILKLI